MYRWVANVTVHDGTSLARKGEISWWLGQGTYLTSVAIGNLDGDGAIEIVVGGYYDDSRDEAFFYIFSCSGDMLVEESHVIGYITSDTYISSVAVGDVDADGTTEIVTGGYYWDGSRYNAFLTTWYYTSWPYEDQQTWYITGSTYVCSVAIGNVDSDGAVEVVACGYHFDGTRNKGMLRVYTGATLALERLQHGT